MYFGRRCLIHDKKLASILRICSIHNRQQQWSPMISANIISLAPSTIVQQHRQKMCTLLPSSCRYYSTTNAASTTATGDLLLNPPNFALTQEWDKRFEYLGREKLGYDSYEWITLVQKKFTGAKKVRFVSKYEDLVKKANAIDLDVACVICTNTDQIDNVIDLVYKLRHTEHATDLSPSSEYAIYRLLLEHNDIENFFQLLNDTINYGLFPNDHCCCLFLDYFVRIGALECAARLATFVMLQEFFCYPLLNYFSARVLLQYIEEARGKEKAATPSANTILPEFNEQLLPQRTETLEEEMSFNEENVKIYRFPWMKVPYSDGHFDLNQTHLLIGKSLEWLSWNLKLANQNEEMAKRNTTLVDAINFLGLVLQEKCTEAEEAIEKMRKQVGQSAECNSIFLSSLKLAQSYLNKNEEQKSDESKEIPAEKNEENPMANMEKDKLLNKIDKIIADSETQMQEEPVKLWKILTDAFQPIQAEEESRLMIEQKRQFSQWNTRRMQFIENQAKRLELNLRIEEIRRRRKELVDEKELLFFFENRHQWEDKALQRRTLEEHIGILKKKGTITEEEYAKMLFEMGQMLKEGKTAAQALEILGTSADVQVALKTGKTVKK